MIRKYVIDIGWDEGSDTYTATMPQLGLSASAHTSERAVMLVRKCARAWIEEARGTGKTVPPPEDLDALVAKRKPRIEIYWSEEDEVFLAESPDLPGCMTHGTTYERALANLKEAMGLWLYEPAPVGPEPRQRVLSA